MKAIAVLLVAAAGACALAVNKTIEVRIASVVVLIYSFFSPPKYLHACLYACKQSDDGDVIDCVDVYQQPAFKHAPPGSRLLLQVSLHLHAHPSLFFFSLDIYLVENEITDLHLDY